MSTNEIMKVIKDHKDERFILGIDGLSRSGKTTLVKKLEENMKRNGIPFHIFHIDDHITERNKRYNTGFAEWYEYYNFQWDIDCLLRNLFQKLQSAIELELPFYHDGTDSCEMKEIQLPLVGVIIVEGVFLQRKEWRDFFIIWCIWIVQERQGFYVKVQKRRRIFQSFKVGIGKLRSIIGKRNLRGIGRI